MTTPESKDWVDELLEQPPPALNDAGFTARTLANLPRRRRMPLWVRPVVQTGLPALLASWLLVHYGIPLPYLSGANLIEWARLLCAWPAAVAVCSLFALSISGALAET